jgi:hypothetical protein
VLLLVLADFFEDEALVVGVEDFEVGFGVVDFVFGLDGVEEGLEFDEGAAFLLDVDDLGDSAEVGEDVVEDVVVVVLGEGADEEDLGGGVLEEKLL